jgi:hypothetical protein
METLPDVCAVFVAEKGPLPMQTRSLQAMIAATPFVGPVADGLFQKGWSLTRIRKLCQVPMRLVKSKAHAFVPCGCRSTILW